MNVRLGQVRFMEVDGLPKKRPYICVRVGGTESDWVPITTMKRGGSFRMTPQDFAGDYRCPERCIVVLWIRSVRNGYAELHPVAGQVVEDAMLRLWKALCVEVVRC